jgi:hypothetical protein
MICKEVPGEQWLNKPPTQLEVGLNWFELAPAGATRIFSADPANQRATR